MSWKINKDKILKTPKFVRIGSMVTVEPKTEPVRAKVKGKFGEREMFIIMTREYGLVYVSEVQFVKIAQLFNDDYSTAITAEL